MNQKILCLTLFLLSLGTIGSAFADQLTDIQYSRESQRIGQQRITESRLHLEGIKTSEIIRNSRDLKYMVERLMENVRRAMDNFRYRNQDMQAIRDRASMVAADARQKAKDWADKQQQDREVQQARMRDLKDRAEALKQQQADRIANTKRTR